MLAQERGLGLPPVASLDAFRCLGRPRGGNSTKIHLRTNAIGLPVAMTLSPGEVSDVEGYEPVMDERGRMPKVLIADKGYDSDAMSRLNWMGRKSIPEGSWLARIAARKPRMLVAIALANKMARTIWAMLTRNEDYQVSAQVAAA
jgi:hypothetical protein